MGGWPWYTIFGSNELRFQDEWLKCPMGLAVDEPSGTNAMRRVANNDGSVGGTNDCIDRWLDGDSNGK